MLIIFFSVETSAQNFHGKIIAGLSASQVSGDNLSGFNKAGFTIGPAASFNFNDNFFSQLELIFIQKGSKKIATETDPSIYKLKLNYVEVPINLFYKYKDKLYFHTGLSFAILINSKEEDVNGKFPVSVPFNKYDFSYNFGLNYNINESYSILARYSNSIFYIRKLAASSTARYWDKGQFNTVIIFALIYNFTKPS